MARHGLRILGATGAPLVWGAVAGWLAAPFWFVALGGLAAGGLAFWLERAVLLSAETRARRDFPLILSAGYAFLAVLGVGLASLGYLAAAWLHR